MTRNKSSKLLSYSIYGLFISILSVSGNPMLEDNLIGENDGKKSYSGYKLIRTMPITQPNLANALMLSFDGKHGIHFWTYPKVNQTVDILASPKLFPYVQSLLNELGVYHDVIIHDVDELLQNENSIPNGPEPEYYDSSVNTLPRGRQLGGSHRMDWSNYHRYNDMLDFVNYMAENAQTLSNNNTQVTKETIGKSTENRDIVLVKISRSNGNSQKPAIWLDGGMHAREWISPATVTYIMNILITDDSRGKELVDLFDWYIVPVINVDGYEYTHDRDRFWRKTRSQTNSWRGCRGVDPNRNWGYQWGGAGTSSDPCSEVYRGPKAFSEPETASVAQAILARKNQIKMYLTFHSYSQLLLIPWGYGKQKPADYNELYSIGLKGKNALENTYQTQYRIGTAPDLLYSAAGGSDDWAKGSAGIKYSYTFELRDKGRYGFALPANQIKPVGEETFNAVKAMALALNESFNRKGPNPGQQQQPTNSRPSNRYPPRFPPRPGTNFPRPGHKNYILEEDEYYGQEEDEWTNKNSAYY